MEKIVKIVLSILLFFVLGNIDAHAAVAANSSSTPASQSSGDFDWEPIIRAIIYVESGGDNKAKSGKSVGAMQITPVCVEECNNILKKQKSKKRFKLSDRFSIAKSKEMFLLLQKVYNPHNNIEQAIRAWNGGNHYSVKRTQHYYEKVMKALKSN